MPAQPGRRRRRLRLKVSFRARPIAIRLLLCSAVAAVCAPRMAYAWPQDPAVPATSLEHVKDRLDTPVVRSLTPSTPVRLRPVFKSGVEAHPFVRTLDEDLHKTFDLNALQRQSADWSSKCCGIDLVGVYKAIAKANEERQVSKAREQVARELAALRAARGDK
jgi:hypothetical protein